MFIGFALFLYYFVGKPTPMVEKNKSTADDFVNNLIFVWYPIPGSDGNACFAVQVHGGSQTGNFSSVDCTKVPYEKLYTGHLEDKWVLSTRRR